MTNLDWLRESSNDEIAAFLSDRFGAHKPLFKLWLNQDRGTALPNEYIYTYPINLIFKVFDGHERFPVQFTEDQINGLYAAMETLTVRESACLRLIFKEFYTLEQAGSVFNVTKERVRQIENKAIRKLRHPSRCRLFLYGLTECSRIDYEAKNITKTQPAEVVLSQPVDVCKLSVRASNCLKRSGVVTIADLLSLSDDDIKKIRNCGPKTANEIMDKRDGYFCKTNKLHN